MIAITFLSLLLASPLSAHDYWLRQQTPTLANLNQIVFTDSLNGWAAGDSGVIIYTSNGGLNWSRLNSEVNYEIYWLHFVNRRFGWAIANDFVSLPFSTILKTTNGGINWTKSFFADSNIRLITIYFLDSLNGWTAGSGQFVYQSIDGGANWIARNRDTAFFSGFPIRCFAFYSPFFGLAGGGLFDYGGIIWRTTDAGLLWNTLQIGPEPVFDLLFVDSLNIIGTGGDLEFGPSIIRSTDAGITWEYFWLGLFGVGKAVARRDSSEIWIPLSFSGKWAYSFNAMAQWDTLSSPNDSALNDAMFVDPNHGWACGANGMVAKYNPVPIGIKNNQSTFPLSNVLYQNYPNPFNPVTTVEYKIAKPSHVVIRIYDVLGRELRTVFDAPQMPGKYKIKLPAIDLPSGVYYYRLVTNSPGETGDFSQTRKMVIIR
jgi:photosystem II stability/assembly factor-like uncharacterized protein